MLIGATIPGGGAGRANVPDDLRVASGPVSTRATAWSLIGLLAVAAAWGSSFPLTKALLERMTPLNFLAVRFTLAALILALIFAKSLHKLSRRTWTRGVLLGIAFASGQILQTIGLQYTPASISGFITGTYVVLTPMWAALLLHSRIGPRVWIGSGIATVGLAILGLNGFSIGVGEAITLASAAVYALHIVGLGAWTTARDAVGLSVVQLGVTALLSVFFASLVEGGVSPAHNRGRLGDDRLPRRGRRRRGDGRADLGAGASRAVARGDHHGDRAGLGRAVLRDVARRAGHLAHRRRRRPDAAQP